MLKLCWPIPLPDEWTALQPSVKRARSSSTAAPARLSKEDSPPEAKMPRYTSSGREIKIPVGDGYAVRTRSPSASSSGRGSLNDDDDDDDSGPPRPLPQVLDPSRTLVLPVFLEIPRTQALLAQDCVDKLNQLLRPTAPHPPPQPRPPPPVPSAYPNPPYSSRSLPSPSWPSQLSSPVVSVQPGPPHVNAAPAADDDAPKRTVGLQSEVPAADQPADVKDVAREVERKGESAGDAPTAGGGVHASAGDARAAPTSSWGRWLKPSAWF